MRRLALHLLILMSLVVVGAAAWLVLSGGNEQSSEPVSGALSESSPHESLEGEPWPLDPQPTERRAVEEAPTLANAKSAAVCSVHGFVLPADGRSDSPVDKLVELDDEHSTLEWTRIEPSGAYSIDHLAPGHYWLTTGSGRDDRVWTEVVLDPNVPSQRVDLRLESPPRLRIRVVDTGGRALENRELMPIATSHAPGDWFDEISGNRNNHFGAGYYRSTYRDDKLFDASSIGYLLLDAPPPVYVSLVRGLRVVATKLVDSLGDDVVFAIDRDSPFLRNASVRWRVVDPVTRKTFDGEPTSRLERLSGAWRRFDQSSNSGERVIRDLVPGPYRLTLQLVLHAERGCARPLDWSKYKSFCDFSEPGVVRCGYSGPNEHRFERTTVLRLEGGEVRDLGEIRLTEGATIAGHVRGPQSEPVHVSVDCAAFDRTTGGAARCGALDVWTDDEGEFRFRGIEPGEYVLHVGGHEPTWAAAAVLVDVRDESVCDVELRVAPPIKCVLRPALASWRAQRFEVRNELGLCIAGVERFESPRPRELLLAPGHYELRTWTLPLDTPNSRAIEIVDEMVSIDLR